MWSEKSQTLKAHMYDYVYMKGPEQANPQRHKTESSLELLGPRAKGGWEWLLIGMEFLFGVMKNVLEWDSGNSYAFCFSFVQTAFVKYL